MEATFQSDHCLYIDYTILSSRKMYWLRQWMHYILVVKVYADKGDDMPLIGALAKKQHRPMSFGVRCWWILYYSNGITAM